MNPTAGPRLLLTAHRIVAGLIVVLVLVQAVIAGRSNRLFGSWNIEVHGVLGNVVLLAALGEAALVVFGRSGRAAAVTVGLLVVAVVAQIGLGYTGRDSVGAAAWHIPLGVAVFGLAVWNLALATRPGVSPAR